MKYISETGYFFHVDSPALSLHLNLYLRGISEANIGDMMNSISPKHSFVSLSRSDLFSSAVTKSTLSLYMCFGFFCGFVYAVLQHFTSLFFQDTITAQ